MNASLLQTDSLAEQVQSLLAAVDQLQAEVDELRQENTELRQQVRELRCDVGYWKSMHARACRLYTSGLNARCEFKPRNREVCHSSDSNPNGLRPWWQFFGSIIVAAESCQQGHEFR